jgi:hypothetical protein
LCAIMHRLPVGVGDYDMLIWMWLLRKLDAAVL